MSTIKATNIQHPSAGSPSLVLSSDGGMVASGLTGAGLDLITSETFSDESAVSIDNCFTATYEAYRYLIYGTNSTAQNLNFRLRSSGSDDSTASAYVTQTVEASSSVASGASFTSNLGVITYVNTAMIVGSGDIFRPALAVPTFVTGIGGRNPSTYTLGISVYHNQSTAYDGLTIFPGTGSMTGTIKIFGYKD